MSTRSKFLKIKCNKCRNEQIVFDRPSNTVRCLVCDSVLAEPVGGKANIHSKILEAL